MPTMRGRNQVDAASGTMPRRPKTKPIRAFVEASRRSIASVMVAPMPDSGAVDRGDHRLRQGMDRQRHPAAGVAHAVVVRRLGEVGAQLLGRGPDALVEAEDVALGGEVHPGAERAAGAGDDHGADGVVAGRR